MVTTEEHSTSGGLGALVAELLTAGTAGLPVLRLGVEVWLQTGTNQHLLEMYGLSAGAVARNVWDGLTAMN